MSKNKTPNPQGPNESGASSAADTFVSGEAVPSGSTSQAEKNRWLIPGVAFASAALLAGALGFAVGSNNSTDMRPVAMSGQSFGQNGHGDRGKQGNAKRYQRGPSAYGFGNHRDGKILDQRPFGQLEPRENQLGPMIPGPAPMTSSSPTVQ